MITSTGAASACSIPASTTSSSNKPTNSNDDSSTSFHDVMQQQEGSSKDTTKTPTPSPSAKAAAAMTPVFTATTTTTTPTSDAPPPTTTPATSAPVPAGSDLAAMIIQASVLASNAQAAKVPVPVTPTATETPTETPAPTPGKETTPQPAADLATLIAQAAPVLFGAQAGTAKTSATTVSTGTTTSQASKDPSTSTSTATSTSTSATTSLAMALASILGSSTPVAGTGKNSTATTTSKDSTTASTKEKKSTTSDEEGSFLQSGTADTSTSLSTLSLLGTLANASANTSVNQTLTPSNGAKNSSTSALLGSAISAAGTANVEKEKDMTSTLTTSATELLSASGANTLVTPKQADLQVQLASNHDFTDALKQVMHVAQLTQTAESRTPMRVEMTVQTPPGAVVNIYVSKAGDSYRAQLGSNDPVALAWVQTQITSLKSTDLGVDVKWLPPQMDSGTPTITTSGSQDANLSWNQGGGQSGYQQPDEQRQQPGANEADDTEYAGAGSTPFMSTLNSSLGRSS